MVRPPAARRSRRDHSVGRVRECLSVKYARQPTLPGPSSERLFEMLEDDILELQRIMKSLI